MIDIVFTIILLSIIQLNVILLSHSAQQAPWQHSYQKQDDFGKKNRQIFKFSLEA